MEKIIDFRCGYDNSVGINKDILANLDIKFQEYYKKCDNLVRISKELKRYEDTNFCELPFCHTLEGEALGGIITLGDENVGPRAKEYICESVEELLDLPEIDYTKGRIGEVLKACKALREEKENVVLCISGPFTIFNVLIEPVLVFKALKKKPELMQKVFDKFQEELLRFVDEAKKAKVNIISYADSSGGVNILGPKFASQVVEMFTYPFLKKVEKRIDNNIIVTLCPKTTFALLGTKKANWNDINIKHNIKYLEGVENIIGRAKFTGQMCVKNTKYRLKNGVIKEVVLV